MYAPCFATFVLVISVVGVYMLDLTFYLANTPPLPVPRLDVDIGTLHVYYRLIGASSTQICLHFSRPPETQIHCG